MSRVKTLENCFKGWGFHGDEIAVKGISKEIRFLVRKAIKDTFRVDHFKLYVNDLETEMRERGLLK